MAEREAGEALNIRVGVEVFGWPEPDFIGNNGNDPAQPIYGWPTCRKTHGEFEDCECQWSWCGREYYPAPDFSRDIAAAWQVVEKMGTYWEANGKPGEIHFYIDGVGADQWGEAEEATLPLAICRAALRAAGREGV